MGNREKSRFSRTARAKAKLGVRQNLINRAEVMEIIKSKDFTNYRKKRYGRLGGPFHLYGCSGKILVWVSLKVWLPELIKSPNLILTEVWLVFI